MKVLKISWMLVAILTCNLFFVSCFSEDNPVSEKEQSEAVFQKQLDEALIWAQVYGPSTQAVAEAVACGRRSCGITSQWKGDAY